MAGISEKDELIQRLLEDRDAEFRRANIAERKLAEINDQDLAKEKSGLERQLASRERQVEKLEEKISKLEQQLEYLKRRMWGSMSERRPLPDDPDQLKFDFDQADMEEPEVEFIQAALDEAKLYQEVKVREHVKKVPVRTKLPETLPHVEEHIYPEGYKGHEEEWVLFDDVETSEHLEFKPAEFYVRVTIRHKGMRKDTNEILTAPLPSEPLPKSYATSSLLADLLVGKYVDHLPFHRQIQRYKRLGVTIPISTIEEWFHGVADLMRPAYYALKEQVLSSGYVQSDETTVPIVDNEKHKTTKGYLWLVKDVFSKQVFFHYYEGSRSAKVAIQLFDKYQGVIQTDGFAGYNVLDKYKGILTLGCWTHTRRYFDRALNNDKARAEYALAQIGHLYTFEEMMDDKHLTGEERAKERHRLSYPVIRAFDKWCAREYNNVLPKSPIGKALYYYLQHSRQLARYVIDGRYKMDTNLVENSVRPVACGRLCGVQHNLPYVGTKFMLAS